jgi:hypothetical protein
MSEGVLDHLANTAAQCLHARRQSNDYLAEVRAAVEKQWRENHFPAAKAAASQHGVGKYTMVYETGHDIKRDELALLLPTELRREYDRGLVTVWWHPSRPTLYDITLNFESKRNLRLRELSGEEPESTKRPRVTDDASEAARARARGVAETVQLIHSVPTFEGRNLMEQALVTLACHDPALSIVTVDDLVLAWERALLKQEGTEASDLFDLTLEGVMGGMLSLAGMR